jgi:hypothetical protein
MLLSVLVKRAECVEGIEIVSEADLIPVLAGGAGSAGRNHPAKRARSAPVGYLRMRVD